MYYISYYTNTLYVLHTVFALHALYMQLVPFKRLLLIIIYVYTSSIGNAELKSNLRNIHLLFCFNLISSNYSLCKSINNILYQFMFIILSIFIIYFFLN